MAEGEFQLQLHNKTPLVPRSYVIRVHVQHTQDSEHGAVLPAWQPLRLPQLGEQIRLAVVFVTAKLSMTAFSFDLVDLGDMYM